jgi:hypothetical protein
MPHDPVVNTGPRRLRCSSRFAKWLKPKEMAGNVQRWKFPKEDVLGDILMSGNFEEAVVLGFRNGPESGIDDTDAQGNDSYDFTSFHLLSERRVEWRRG